MEANAVAAQAEDTLLVADTLPALAVPEEADVLVLAVQAVDTALAVAVKYYNK
jgi:hypothetical protein